MSSSRQDTNLNNLLKRVCILAQNTCKSQISLKREVTLNYDPITRVYYDPYKVTIFTLEVEGVCKVTSPTLNDLFPKFKEALVSKGYELEDWM